MQLGPSSTTATVTRCLIDDHARLDRLLDQVVIALDGDLSIARSRFPEYARQLRAHLQFEEELMFPILERLCQAAGPVCVLRRDHRELEDRLTGLQAALYLDDLDAFRAEYEALVETLDNHHGREERVLYPAIDRALDDGSRARLIDDICVRR